MGCLEVVDFPAPLTCHHSFLFFSFFFNSTSVVSVVLPTLISPWHLPAPSSVCFPCWAPSHGHAWPLAPASSPSAPHAPVRGLQPALSSYPRSPGGFRGRATSPSPPEHRYGDPKVTAGTDFQPVSQSTGSEENFNEDGCLVWMKLSAKATKQRLLRS